MNPIDSMWAEKYRPKKLDDMIGDFKPKIHKYLESPSKMQHLLFHSITPGTGKTTLAKVIISELGADALFLNSSDDRKIETVREKINGFVKSKSSVPGMRRIVFLDEADGLTAAAQNALRNLMETYESNALFILTCNNINKINDAIQSRCAPPILFTTPNKNEIIEYLKKICDGEGLEYTEDGLRKIIDINYPSIRNCVQVLQSLHTEGKSAIVDTAKGSDEDFQRLWGLISDSKDYKTVKQYLFENNVDIRELNKFFWFKAVELNHIKIMQITCSNEKTFCAGGEELIVFITSLLDMVK